MEPFLNIEEKRREKFAYLQNNALAIFLVSLTILLASIYAREPNLIFLGCNVVTGVGAYVSWYFGLKGKENQCLAAAVGSIVLIGFGMVQVINWPFYLILGQGFSSNLVVLSLCLLTAGRKLQG